MVTENRPLLDALAHTLLENEVLERDDIERLVADYRGGGGGGSNGKRASRVVPVSEPGAPRVAASERLEGQAGGDSPS